MLQVRAKWLTYATAVVMGLASMAVQAAGEMKPFILGSTSSGNVSDHIDGVKKSLTDNGFEVAGEYSPYDTAHIIIVTNGTMKKMAASHERGGYAAAARVSITKVGDEVQVAYTNPPYMAAAYHVQGDAASVKTALKTALGEVKEYGPANGLDADDLNGYHYTFGMEYFDEPYALAEYNNYKEAVAAVEKGLAAHAGGTTKVYRIDVPGSEQTVFGVGMSSGDTGNKYMDDEFIMSEVDFKEVRSTAHLPYEILVSGDEVEALHARFRIAVNFPDLSMMGDNSFMNIMPSPDAIKDALTKASGGSADEDF